MIIRPAALALFGLLASSVPAQTMTGKGLLQAHARADCIVIDRSSPFPGGVEAFAWKGWALSIAKAGAALDSPLKAHMWVSASSRFRDRDEADASVDVVLTIRAAKPMAGQLVVTAQSPVGIGIGGRRSVFVVSGTQRGSVVVTNDGLPVYVSLSAQSPDGPFSNDVTVEFVPTAGAVLPHGTPCPIELQGAWWRARSNDILVVRSSRAPPTPFAFLLLGTRKLNIPLPPTNCLLRTDFPIVYQITISNGDHVGRLLMPRLSGLTFHAQTVVLERRSPPIWRTSNGLTVKVP